MDDQKNYLREKKKNSLRQRMILSSEEEEQEDSLSQEDSGDYDRLIQRRRLVRIGVRIGLVFLAAGLLAAWFYYRGPYQYDSFEVVWEMELAEGSLSSYTELDGNLVKYSRDGASCLDQNGEILWTQSFEIKEPFVDVCGEYMVIAEKQGYQFFIFSKEGLSGTGKTNQPITKASVAATGTVIVLTEREKGNDIDYYDKTGTQVRTGISTALAQHGVAMDADLSPSGMMIAASFVYLNQGTLSNKEIFYNFSEAGKEYTDRLVGGFDEEYKDSMIGETAFLGDSMAVVFAEGKVDFYSLKNQVIPKLKISYPYQREMKSVFYNDSYVGVISLSPDESEKYFLTVYNSAGGQLFEKPFGMEYTDAGISDDLIWITDNTQILMLDEKGTLRYEGQLDGNVDFLIHLDGSGFVQVSGNKLKGIVLK